MSKLSRVLAVSLAAAATMAISSSANALVYDIDLFSQPGLPTDLGAVVTDYTGGDGGISVQQGPYGGVLGSYRDLMIDKFSTFKSDGSPVLGPASLGVYGGALEWSNDSGVKSTATVQWDGNDSPSTLNATGLLGFNLRDACGAVNSCKSLVATLLAADLGFNYDFTIYTDAGNWSRISTGSVGSVGVGGAYTYQAPYASVYDLDWFLLPDNFYFIDGLPFTVSHAGSGANLNSVGAMELVMVNDGTCYTLTGSGQAPCATSVDVTITSFQAVPEPGSMALVGFGLVGLAGLRRRKAA